MTNIFEDALIRALQSELEQCINQENKEWLIREVEIELDDLLYIQACDERQVENNIWS